MATQLLAPAITTAASEFFVLAEGASGSALDASAAPMTMLTLSFRSTILAELFHLIMNTVPASLTDFTATTNLLMGTDPSTAARGAIVLYFSVLALLTLVLRLLFLVSVLLVVVLVVVGHDDNGYAVSFYHNVR